MIQEEINNEKTFLILVLIFTMFFTIAIPSHAINTSATDADIEYVK